MVLEHSRGPCGMLKAYATNIASLFTETMEYWAGSGRCSRTEPDAG